MDINDLMLTLQGHLAGLLEPEKVIGVPAPQFEISRQKNMYTCGSRSAYMILRHFGHQVRHQDIRQALNTNPKTGTHERPMCALFRCVGLDAYILKQLSWKKLTRLLEQRSVLLASVDGDDHYIVVHGVTEKVVHLADPFDYRPWRRIVPKHEFMQRWDRWGVVVSR